MNNEEPIVVFSAASPDSEIIGHCKGCGTTHSGPLIFAFQQIDGDIIIEAGIRDDANTFHMLDGISLRQIVDEFEAEITRRRNETGGSNAAAS